MVCSVADSPSVGPMIVGEAVVSMRFLFLKNEWTRLYVEKVRQRAPACQGSWDTCDR
jgi:hypothetical protein